MENAGPNHSEKDECAERSCFFRSSVFHQYNYSSEFSVELNYRTWHGIGIGTQAHVDSVVQDILKMVFYF